MPSTLDADIQKFFDTIPHSHLEDSLRKFIGEENQLVRRYLKRFYSVDKVEWKTYRGKVEKFYKEKPVRKHRELGIPQGGIISGMIANIYLHQFDQWVLGELNKIFDLKYVRYADDFVIFLKNKNEITLVKNIVAEKLSSIGLTLHPNENKTKELDLMEKSVEFVGFSISPKGIRVKKDNLYKFKSRIIDVMQDSYAKHHTIKELIWRLNYKIIGNEAFGMKTCCICNNLQPIRSWMTYFLTCTDIRQIKSIDKWIRKLIYIYYYKKIGKRIKKSDLVEMGLHELLKTYYRYHKDLKKVKFCSCDPGIAEFIEIEEILET